MDNIFKFDSESVISNLLPLGIKLLIAVAIFVIGRYISRLLVNSLEKILKRAKYDDSVLKTPAPVVMVLELGESSVDIAVRPWVNAPDYWTACADLLQKIKKEFDDNGISIPYPQIDLHLVNSQSNDSITIT